MKIKLSILLLLLLLNALGVVAEEVKIGVIGPMTGDMASFGSDAAAALELAQKDLLKEGFNVKLIFEDGRCSGGKEAAIAAQKLVRIEGVKAIIGSGCSSEILVAAPITEQGKVVLLSTYGESAEITKAGDYVFRISPSAVVAGKLIAEAMLFDGRRRVAIISENSDYALSFRDVAAQNLLSAGYPAVASDSYNNDLNDFRTLLLRLKSSTPDALLINPQSGLKAGLIAKQVRELHWNLPLYGNFAFSSVDARSSAGNSQALEGLKFADAPVISSSRGLEILARLKKTHGEPQSDFHVVSTYDALMLLAQAIRSAGYDGTKIRDYLYAMDKYEGAGFTIRFDKNGDVLGIKHSIKQIDNGQVEVMITGKEAGS